MAAILVGELLALFVSLSVTQMADDIQLPNELLCLSNLMENNPASFTSGRKDVQVAALIATKFVFDLGTRSKNLVLPASNLNFILKIIQPFNPKLHHSPP